MVTKKIVIGALLIIGSVIGLKTLVCSRHSNEEKVKYITEKMTRKLSLSEEQKAQVFQINLERAKGHENAYRHGRKRELIQNAAAKWSIDLKQVLTAEQAKKLKI